MKFFPKVELPITPALVCLLTGNLLDGIVTLTLLQLGMVFEVNPIMAEAYRVSPLVFMTAKMCMVHGLLLIVVVAPGRFFKWWLIRFAAFIYLVVVGYQCILCLKVY
jgi:hypothetical protein